ncbi:MAG: SMI1/KNR4 family protein [Saprospiraceae bacterium]|nr:SMI1/KNR4 family protein [Saprospiraceae bacterium]
MKEQKIREIIDHNLKKIVDIELNKLPINIEEEMSDPNQDKNEEWRIWYPIKSKVTDKEIEDFENQIQHKLPDDYKMFLKYKHFYELYISEVTFTRHPVNSWRANQIKAIFKGYPNEYLIDKGFIPFADWSDWGLLCFDTNQKSEGNNYPIVLWDHEIADEVTHQYTDFYEMMLELELAEQTKSDEDDE